MMCCPANADATVWTKRALSSEEGSDFMRKILRSPKTAVRRISSHSLKSTFMSWTAKYGLSEHSRAVLARHLSKAATATAVYSRDLLSPILREFNLVLDAIKSGAFCPDSTRSGMLTPGAIPYMRGTPLPMAMSGAPATPVPEGVRHQCDTEVEADKLSEGSFVPCENSSDGEALFGAPSVGPPSVANSDVAADDMSEATEENSVQSSPESDAEDMGEQRRDFIEIPSEYVINNKPLVLHFVKSPSQLACGRKLTPSYSKIFELNGIRCSRCFNV